MNKTTKIYQVEFVEYTNCRRDTISNGKPIGQCEYLKVSESGFLVREEHIDYVREYGKGIKSLKLVGELLEISPPNYFERD